MFLHSDREIAIYLNRGTTASSFLTTIQAEPISDKMEINSKHLAWESSAQLNLCALQSPPGTVTVLVISGVTNFQFHYLDFGLNKEKDLLLPQYLEISALQARYKNVWFR